jgi:hypothetical protein
MEAEIKAQIPDIDPVITNYAAVRPYQMEIITLTTKGISQSCCPYLYFRRRYKFADTSTRGTPDNCFSAF